MLRKIFFLFVISGIATACNMSTRVSPDPTSIPAGNTDLPTNTTTVLTITPIPGTEIPTEIPTSTPTMAQPVFEGSPASFGKVSLVFPAGLASGLSGKEVPRADAADLPPWSLTPGHTQVKLEGYFLQDQFHEPQIYVYPASGYAEIFPAAFESMNRLRNVMAAPPETVTSDQLPFIPFFNAAQIFTSNFQPIAFQNGDGVRYLAQYDQYTAQVNNHELFYLFMGFSSNGEQFIIAILPITVPVLAETGDPNAGVPAGGVPFPDINSSENDFQAYYNAVAGLLEAESPSAFSPALGQLDLLIESLRIAP